VYFERSEQPIMYLRRKKDGQQIINLNLNQGTAVVTN